MLKQFKRYDESSEQHSEIEAEPEPEPETELEQPEREGKSTNSELMNADDMEFEMELTNDDELNEVEFIVNKREIKLIGENGVEVVDIDENDIEGLFISNFCESKVHFTN